MADGTSCIIEMWGSFVQTLSEFQDGSRALNCMGPSMPRNRPILIDLIWPGYPLNVVLRLRFSQSPGPLGTLSDEAHPPGWHFLTDGLPHAR